MDFTGKGTSFKRLQFNLWKSLRWRFETQYESHFKRLSSDDGYAQCSSDVHSIVEYKILQIVVTNSNGISVGFFLLRGSIERKICGRKTMINHDLQALLWMLNMNILKDAHHATEHLSWDFVFTTNRINC